MTGLKLRIAILTVSVLSFFYYVFIPYFPDGVYYKIKMKSVFSNLNEEFRRLEAGLSKVNSSSELENLQLEFPIVSGLTFVSESDLVSRKDAEGKLLAETLKAGTSRLLFLKPSLVFCLPNLREKKLILAEFREDLFRVSFSGAESMLIPDLKFGSYVEPGKRYDGLNQGRISFLLIDEMNRSQSAVHRIQIGSIPFIGYYYAMPENSYGFLKGILILKPGSEGLFFLFLSVFLAILFLIDLMIRILRIKRNLFTSKEGKEIQEIVGRISKGIDKLQTAKQETLESVEKEKIEEIQTLTSEEVDLDLNNSSISLKEVKREDGPSIFVLPFELKKEGYISPAFLRDPEKFKTHTIVPPEIEKKRSEIFTPELEDLISKVSEPVREKSPSPVEETAKSDSKPMIRSRNLELGPGYMKWLGTLQIRDRRKILEVLDELSYGLESEYSFILKYYTSVFSSLKLFGFSIHYYDRRNGSYSPFVTYGLKERTSENMIFLYDDQYIGKELGTYSCIEITEEKKMDRFFRKKFDPIDLESCISILTIPLSNFGIPFRFFLFFKDSLMEENAQEIENLIFHSLEPVIPAFEEHDRKILGELFRDKRDVVSSRIHLMRIATDGERGLMKSFRMEFHGKDFKKLESLRKKMMSQIFEIIDPEDMCFGIGVGAFGLYTKKDLGERIRSLADQTGNAYDFIVDVYPENGKNLFTYL
ncbi:hypothetical protein [Leptospira borgpetersenii]|uniref:hypothetical protein n=1 Tax=Leptospira borgpetersenii TaxID=174 RepID=UPI00034B2955|nr:hypothetical protein [Leptospira borgpetersenii]URD69750.1 hypothetical protein LIX26_14220 [Leptospira borgpetersenii]UVD72925.1 hypothetical protein NU962_14290 [Leptospira borgpetersenii]UVD76120.1 hypothetical protein LIX27_14355 [Leptospira borgpetersenii]UZW32678.1 hypothetical protein OR565_14360 [Leptospira borgpetersenii]